MSVSRDYGLCRLSGCNRAVHVARYLLCNGCYQRLKRSGELEMVSPSAEDRFFAKVQSVEMQCWEWTGALSHGYGDFWDGKRVVRAHRWVWEFFNGPIPEGLHVDHLCVNRRCVNPDHLDPVPQQVNITRAIGRDYCPYGHPREGRTYSGQLLADGTRQVERRCLVCHAAREKERSRKRRASEREARARVHA